MDFQPKILFLLTVLLTWVIATNALQCYSCISGLGSGCDDEFDSNGSGVEMIEKDLSGEPCMSCTKTKADGYGVKAVVRSCSQQTDDRCISSGDSHVCSCTGNLCNSATFQRISFSTYMFVSIISLCLRCFV